MLPCIIWQLALCMSADYRIMAPSGLTSFLQECYQNQYQQGRGSSFLKG